MSKTKFLSLLLASVLLLPSLFACGSSSDDDSKAQTTGSDTTSKVTADYAQPDTEITDSPDGSTRVVYALSVANSGEFDGEIEQTLSGNTTSEITVTPGVGYEFVRWSDGNTSPTRSGDKGTAGKITTIYAIVSPVYLEMPVLQITTETGYDVESKEEYIAGTLSITNCSEEFALDSRMIEIRGRGNNSWTYEKKSYHIQLDSKANLLGIGEAKGKHWNLLANHCDQSLLRNYTALHFAAMMNGIGYSPACTNVEVYLNGEYRGVYLLCEAIRVGEGRVDIQEDPEAGTDIGYLVQLSNYAEAPMFNVGGKNYEIKSDLSTDEWLAWEQYMYIQDYIATCFDAVESGDRQRIEELMDLNSIVDTYIVEETVKNLDVGWDSFYLYKDAGGKLALGPIWDFDLSLGNANEGCENYTDLYAAQGSKGQSNPWFYNLMAYHWFRELVAERWASEEVQTVVKSLSDLISEQATDYNGSFCRNFDKWQIFGQCLNREPRQITRLSTYDEHSAYLVEWLNNRIEWMNGYIGGERYNEGYNTEIGNGGIVVPTPDPSFKFECSGGTGKYSDPYLISTARDFMNLTLALYSGESFAGTYFRQTADLDMNEIDDYIGIGSQGTFAGVYDGNGYTIHAELSGTDQCIFPYVSGLIMNLGTTGSVRNTAQAAGICRSIRQGGGIVNCYSLMDVSSTESGLAGGISASTQSGDNVFLVNCYFGGTVSGSECSPSNVWQEGRGGNFSCLYSSEHLGAVNLSPADLLLTQNEMETELAALLNAHLNDAADAASAYHVNGSSLCNWTQDGGLPVMVHK